MRKEICAVCGEDEVHEVEEYTLEYPTVKLSYFKGCTYCGVDYGDHIQVDFNAEQMRKYLIDHPEDDPRLKRV